MGKTSNIQAKKYTLHRLITEKAVSRYEENKQIGITEAIKQVKAELAKYIDVDVSTINRDARITYAENKDIPKARQIAYAHYFEVAVSQIESKVKPTKKGK